MILSPLILDLPALAAGALLLVAPARGDDRAVQLHVGAKVITSCRFEADVPRVATANRTNGTASFRVKCTQGGSANAAPCSGPCAPVTTDDRRGVEYRLVESRDGGATVTTILF
jgi:hypothetical protein